MATVPQRRESRCKTAPPGRSLDYMRDGFLCKEERHAFRCREENQAEHSLPKEALSFQPDAKDVVVTFKNGDQERKIYCNCELQHVEQERLSELRREAKAQGCSFSPSVVVMASRFLSRARMDPQKALRLMTDTQMWREQYFKSGPVCDASVLEDLRQGVVYVTGRDHALRPAIVVRANRVPRIWYKEKCIDRFNRILIFCMEYLQRHMFLPGRVENLSVIIDLKGLGLSQVPVGLLADVYKVMSHHYLGRVFKFYVCNASLTLNAIAGCVTSMLTDRQRQKIAVLSDVKELRKEFALHQLEEDLGGSRPLLNEFFPFPLLPGPFEAGHAGGPNEKEAVPNLHRLISSEGALGHLWDATRTPEDYAQLGFNPGAAAVLREHGLPVPAELLLPSLPRQGASDAALSSPGSPASITSSAAGVSARCPPSAGSSGGGADDVQETTKLVRACTLPQLQRIGAEDVGSESTAALASENNSLLTDGDGESLRGADEDSRATLLDAGQNAPPPSVVVIEDAPVKSASAGCWCW